MDSSRKAFEAWLTEQYGETHCFAEITKHNLYVAWQAARADLLAMLDKPEVVEDAAAAYAKKTGYYVEFHKGLKSVSSDKIRDGIRAAIEALKKELRG